MNKQQLATKIWESANKMRSKIEANEYKDYILGFILVNPFDSCQSIVCIICINFNIHIHPVAKLLISSPIICACSVAKTISNHI